MLKITLSLLLAGLLFHHGSAGHVLAKSKAAEEAHRIEKVKVSISRLGVGKEARVALKLRDKTKLAGYISRVEEDHFVVAEMKGDASTIVAYADVTQVKGHNLSTGAKIAIGVGIGVGVVILILLLIRLNNEGGL